MVLVDYQPLSAGVAGPHVGGGMTMTNLSERTNELRSPSSGDDVDPSSRSFEEEQELLIMEAGFSAGSSHHSSSLNKSMMDDTCSQRIRSSIGSSFSDGSFLTATQQERESFSQQSSSSEDDDASITSRVDSEPDLELQLRDHMAPPPGEAKELICSRPEQVSGSSGILLLQDDDANIPVISLDRLELLKYKAKPVQRPVPAPRSAERDNATVGVETRSMDTRSVDTILSQEDQQSVTSVQSLVSVVAELIAIPIRIVTAAIADLEQEVVAVPSGPPERAEFISVSILKSPLDMDALGLTLQTDITKDGKKQVLVIHQIDADGPWHASPLRRGDRIVSINHVAVSHWAPAAVDHYWSTLTDSVSLVAHNPSGDPQKVAVMITKPDPSSRTGLGMRSSRPGRIKISRVNGLFANTLLSPGDLILSINGNKVDGQNSSDTANAILASPKYVTVMARSSHQNAFVISTNSRPNETTEATESLVHSSTTTGEANSNPTMDREGQDNPTEPRPELHETDRCDNCGGSWTTITVLQWVGNIYVALLLSLGLFLCFDQHLGLSFVMGVLVLSLVMANMININIRQVQRQLIYKERKHHCGTFQISANIVVIGAFTFLMLMWQQLEYGSINMEFVVTVTLLILAPMLLFINLPSCCVRPRQGEDFEFEDDYDHSAVASLASHRI